MTHSRSALELRTPRLHLRTLRPEDAAPLAAYRSLPEVARYQAWEGFDLAAAERLVADQAGIVPNTAGTWLQLALVLAESGSVVGDCGLHFLANDPRQVELGITLAPAHQGRGLAAEALTAVLAYLFGELEKHRAIAVTDAANHAAAALFLRLGFRREGTFVENCWFKGAWGSECLSPCCAGNGFPTARRSSRPPARARRGSGAWFGFSRTSFFRGSIAFRCFRLQWVRPPRMEYLTSSKEVPLVGRGPAAPPG